LPLVKYSLVLGQKERRTREEPMKKIINKIPVFNDAQIKKRAEKQTNKIIKRYLSIFRG